MQFCIEQLHIFIYGFITLYLIATEALVVASSWRLAMPWQQRSGRAAGAPLESINKTMFSPSRVTRMKRTVCGWYQGQFPFVRHQKCPCH